jgi:predicted  nucleic acid-binding Zn-ribbon protein
MQLKLLWDLQELDLSIAALTEEIENTPLRESVREAGEMAESLKTETEGEENRLKELRRKLKNLELDLLKKSSEREALHKKLYGGEVGNIKELEQMEKKLNFLVKEQQALEEETLALMEAVEELERLLQGMHSRGAAQAQELLEKERQLEEQLAGLSETKERLQAERAALAGRIEPRWLERYNIMAQRHHGRGLARVVNDICEGCRVFISSAQRGFLYNPQALVYCESCGRLLIKSDRQNDGVEQ